MPRLPAGLGAAALFPGGAAGAGVERPGRAVDRAHVGGCGAAPSSRRCSRQLPRARTPAAEAFAAVCACRVRVAERGAVPPVVRRPERHPDRALPRPARRPLRRPAEPPLRPGPADGFPTNYPDEFFYNVVDSDVVNTPGCGGTKPGKALVRMALEGTFLGGDPGPRGPDRLRPHPGHGLQRPLPERDLHLQHPYGQQRPDRRRRRRQAEPGDDRRRLRGHAVRLHRAAVGRLFRRLPALGPGVRAGRRPGLPGR